MAKQTGGSVNSLLHFIAWLTGVIVSLAVAFGMVDGVLTIATIPLSVTVFFGWVVVVTTLLSVVLVIVKKFQ